MTTRRRLAAVIDGKSVVTKRDVAIEKTGDFLCQLPPIQIRGHIAELNNRAVPSRSERWAAMGQAADIFRSEVVAGLSPNQYVAAVTTTTGLNSDVVFAALDNIATTLKKIPEILENARPKGTYWDWREVPAGGRGAVYSPKGRVLSVVAPANGPGPHMLWPQAIGLGYRVAVRPSAREPYTPERLVHALSEAGLGSVVSLIPCAQAVVPELVTTVDYTLMYGGEALVDQYKDNDRVIIQGPGRSKVIIGKKADREVALSIASKSVTDFSGKACLCASAILVEGNHREFANELEKIIPNMIEVTDSVTDPRVQMEWPTAYSVVAPFNPAKDLSAVGRSLVVTAVGVSDLLIDALVADGTISNLNIGAIPTTTIDIMNPHDGYLGEALMFCRGIIKE